jgi:hypothetical protein
LGETVAWWAIERADAVLFATNTREPFFKVVGFAEGKANQVRTMARLLATSEFLTLVCS